MSFQQMTDILLFKYCSISEWDSFHLFDGLIYWKQNKQ